MHLEGLSLSPACLRASENWSYELQVFKQGKTSSNIISTSADYPLAFLSHNAIGFHKARIQGIVKEESRARTPLKDSREEFHNGVLNTTMSVKVADASLQIPWNNFR